MRPLLLLASLAAVLAPLRAAAAETPNPPAKSPDAGPTRHPLRGVVTRVDAERSALMVKHEDIPGVMRAMTMLFKVDAATLKAVKAGDAITGKMSRQGANWVLEDVKVAEPKKS